MAGGSDSGVADDADAYVDLPDAQSRARGIADDADAFEGLHPHDVGNDRSLDSPWLYRHDGAVFGPVPARELLELVYAGELGAETEVAPEEGEFLPLERFGAFRPHLAEAERLHEARRAAERRARSEAIRRRNRRLRWAGLALAIAVVGSSLVYGVVRWRRAALVEAERERREQALEAELARLLDGVSIEPPLQPLVRGATSGDRSRAPSREARRVRRRPPRAGSARGLLTDREVVEGVQRAFAGLAACIKAQLRRDPASVPARIVLRFGIDNGGRAQRVTFDDRFLRRSPMRGCFEDRLSGVRWRAYEGEVRNVEYPITVRRPS